MNEESFSKIFTRKLNSAAVKTAKAEEKMLEDEQYVPPPGHISILKCKFNDGGAGEAFIMTLGGGRMQESRTWKHASELFCRNFHWSSQDFEVGELFRLKSFKVTTTKGRTSTGSVTPSLFGATFVDLEPQDSSSFHLLVAFGDDVDRFCSNNSLLEVKGSVGDKIEADVTKWLPEKIVYREFQIPEYSSDGSELIQKGDVPIARSGAQLGILKKLDQNSSFLILCTGGVCNPSPGPIKYLPTDSNIFLLRYPDMVWTKLPSQDLLMRSHHSMYISNSTVYIVGGYSWSDNKVKKLFPVTEFTRITFDDFQVQMIDVIKLAVTPAVPNFSPFISGFALAGLGSTFFMFGGIAFPKYDPDKENLHCYLPPETPRNKLPDPASQLLKVDLEKKSLTIISGPKDCASHMGSMEILNTLEPEPLILMTCDPHLYIYKPV